MEWGERNWFVDLHHCLQRDHDWRLGIEVLMLGVLYVVIGVLWVVFAVLALSGLPGLFVLLRHCP